MPLLVPPSVASRALSLTFGLLALLLLVPFHAPSQDEDFLRPATPLPQGRAFHGAAVLRNYLYVFGGSILTGPDMIGEGKATHVARIEPNGTLSRFVPTTPMPVARHYINNSTVVLNDTVYVIGGSDRTVNGKRLNTVIYSKPTPNGMLEPWSESAPLDMIAVSSAAAFATPGYLHLTGGLPEGAAPVASVSSCRMNADGSLGAWELNPPLPRALWFHHAAVAGGRVYLWGGLLSDPGNNRSTINPETAVYSAPILGNGKLGTWRTEQVSLPQGFYGASVAVAGPYVFSISPRYAKGENSNDIWWTMVTPEGMKPWSKRPTPLPIKVQHAAAMDYRRGIIFISGGKPSFTDPPIAVNAMIRLSPKAQAWAESLWLQQETAHRNSLSTTQLFEEEAASGATLAAPTMSTLPGFLALGPGREQARGKRQPLLVYFGMRDARTSREQEALLAETNLAGLKSKAVLAHVDAKDSPQDAQQYGVYRVPTWVAYDPQGNELGREVGVLTMGELEALASGQGATR